jgi:hypothetical protein
MAQDFRPAGCGGLVNSEQRELRRVRRVSAAVAVSEFAIGPAVLTMISCKAQIECHQRQRSRDNRSGNLVECSAFLTFNGKVMKLASVRHYKKRGAFAANVMIAV